MAGRLLPCYAVRQRRRDKLAKQRVRLAGAALELGVGLGGYEPGVFGQLDHLDQAAVGREARHDEARFLQPAAIGVAHLVAVAMPLVYELGAIGRMRHCA